MSEQTSWVGREEAAQPHTPYVVALRTRGEGLGEGGAHGERGGGAEPACAALPRCCLRVPLTCVDVACVLGWMLDGWLATRAAVVILACSM